MTLPAMFDGGPSDVQFARPLGDSQTLTIPFDKIRQSAISVLLKVIGPSAIIWRIALCIVNAINGMARRWSWSHVRIEIGKATPTISNRQSLSAVFLERRRIWITATLNNMRPYVVFSRFVKTVDSSCSRNGFTSQASAGFLSCVKRITLHRNALTARALTVPVSDFVRIMRRTWISTNHRKPSVNVSNSVNYWSTHKAHLTMTRSV